MKRLMMVSVIVIMLVFAAAATAFADAPAPTGNGPGNPQAPTTNPASTTPTTGQNCYGQENSNTRKGPGPAPTGGAANPGSYNQPTSYNGQLDYTGHAVSTLPPGDISGFQQQFRQDAASCGDTGKPA